MAGLMWNVQIWHPGAAEGNGEEYWADGEGGRLASLYGRLLGMERIHIGYMKLVKHDGSLPEIGFENGPHDRRARWPDPDYPQQLHLDIEVGDLDVAEQVALDFGATQLQDNGDYRIFADPVGHPFCLYPNPQLGGGAGGPLPGRIARIVVDCFSPRALAPFYEELLDMPTRVLDTPDRVVIANAQSSLPMLAFQHSVSPAPRWPDPDYPAQIHLDLSFEDIAAAHVLLDRLGAIRLREGEYHSVYADPAAHPFCVGAMGRSGPGQVDEYQEWLAAHPD